MKEFRENQRVYYTGQCLDRGVVRARVSHIDDTLGLVWLSLDDDPLYPVSCTTHAQTQFVFKSRIEAERAAFYEVAEAESSARRMRQQYDEKCTHFRGLLDALTSSMNGSPSITLGAAGRVIR